MTTLHVRVSGRPAPEGSHELGQHGHVMHSSTYLAAWRAAVRNASLRVAVDELSLAPGDLPVFGKGVPVYLHRVTHIVHDSQCRGEGTDEPVGAPDVDKLLRATIDGLGDAKIFHNDSQIVYVGDADKVRTRTGQAPGAVIIISDEPPGAAVKITRESNVEYRISLERVTRDADGDRVYESAFELFGDAGTIVTAGVTTLGALLGVGEISVALPEAAETNEAAADEKPKRGRPRKTVPPAAEPAPAEPVATPVPSPQAEAAVAAMDAVTDTPPAGPVRVNPFA